MKTIVIWNKSWYGIQYFVLDGDYSHLNEVYIGSIENEAEQDELLQLTDSIPSESFLNRFPKEVFYSEYCETPDQVAVIEAGFIP